MMTRSQNVLRVFLLASVIFAALAADRAQSSEARATSSDSQSLEKRFSTHSTEWYEGAEGYRQGLEHARLEGRPMAVYFRTDWCPYCRQLETSLLSTAEVENYLRYLVKVRINPEKGSVERQLASQYRVRGYPAFFVHVDVDQSPRKVSRTTVADGERRLMTPEEFVRTVRRAAEGS